MKKTGFTLMEVIISCGILALFMTGVITLYTEGGKVGNTTMWLQNTTNQLKLATRQINMSISKSSYPAVLKFPNGITKNTNNAFNIHYLKSVASGSNTDFLRITEAVPAQTGKGNDNDKVASLSYHVFSIENTDLIYTRYHETKTHSEVTSLSGININSSARKYRAKLVSDIDSVKCDEIENSDKNKCLTVTIKCRMPRSNTTRWEETIGVPNVNLVNGL
jgi:Tfp pilus assembly protein PilV